MEGNRSTGLTGWDVNISGTPLFYLPHLWGENAGVCVERILELPDPQE